MNFRSYIQEQDIGLLSRENRDAGAVLGIWGSGGIFVRRITIRRKCSVGG